VDNNVEAMSISDAIGWIRERHGLGFKDIAKAAGVGANQPSRIEHAAVSPRCNTVYLILDSLKVTEEERHEFAHMAFDLDYPLGGETKDPLMLEINRYIEKESWDFRRGILFMLRLQGKGGGLQDETQDSQTGHG
jgi:transcriptional regulator with XRE-family HTH domain